MDRDDFKKKKLWKNINVKPLSQTSVFYLILHASNGHSDCGSPTVKTYVALLTVLDET